MQPKQNNLVNIIKFTAAALVIFSHAFALGIGGEDFLSSYSRGIIGLGAVAVTIFFTFSGFYITKSILKSDYCFLRKRLKKIFPCLFITVLLCILLLSAVSDYTLGEYFTNPAAYLYLLNSIGIPVHNLPGVFTRNIYGATVNGALWTIIVEVGCYLSTWILYKLNLLKKHHYSVTFAGLCIICVGCYFLFDWINLTILQSALRPFLIYSFSAWLYLYSDTVKKHQKKILIAALLLIAVTFIINKPFVYDPMLIFSVPVILTALINGKINITLSIGGLEKISYQMYLVGFPIQQLLVHFFGGSMSPYLNFILALVIDIPVAYLLWLAFDQRSDSLYNQWLRIN